MAGVGPSWFAADQVFEGNGGWYVGSRDGFSIGPYDSESAAQAEAAELRRHVAGTRNVSEMLNAVRRLIEMRQQQPVGERTRGRLSPVRDGEPPRIGERSPRFFVLYGKWYFMTREGIDVGPYASKDAAAREQQRLLDLLQGCQGNGERRRAIFEFMTAPGGTCR